jgi:hypothetical protein
VTSSDAVFMASTSAFVEVMFRLLLSSCRVFAAYVDHGRVGPAMHLKANARSRK